MQSVYSWNTLPSDDSIRVLKLFPALNPHNINEPLKGKLLTRRIGDQHDYSAVSYVRGRENKQTEQDLSINGCTLKLRSNLATALRAYRAHCYQGQFDIDIPLWIDAICIKQDDVEEKNQHVQQMDAIFKEAQSVLVWTGPQTQLDIFDCLRDPAVRSTASPAKRRKKDSDLSLLLRCILNTHWTRTWSIQEICLAQRIILFTDQRVFHQDVLDKFQTDRGKLDELKPEAWQPLAAHTNPHAVVTKYVNQFMKIWAIRHSMRDERWNSMDLLTTIYHLSPNSHCYEHRDKVFAFLGLCGKECDLKVDYNAPETQIFCDVIRNAQVADIKSEEVDYLRESLNLTWSALYKSTTSSSLLHNRWNQMLISCHLDCGVLTRARQPLRSCRTQNFTVNACFRRDTKSASVLVQLDLIHVESKTYDIRNLKLCLGEKEPWLIAGLTTGSSKLLILDGHLSTKWETAALEPRVFFLLAYLAELQIPANLHKLSQTMQTTRVRDPHFAQRSAKAWSGIVSS